MRRQKASVSAAARAGVKPSARPRADRERLQEAAALIRASERPLIVAGGGVLYSEATDALRRFVDATGIAVGETQAGKGSLPDPHPFSLGGVGATGTRAANLLARDADLVIVVGSRLSDFTTASKTAFQHERVRFVTINVAEMDAGKHGAVPLVGDARAVLDELLPLLAGYRVGRAYTARVARTPSRLPTSSSAPRAACLAICTSSGARAIRRATTSNTATRAWGTRSPAASG